MKRRRPLPISGGLRAPKTRSAAVAVLCEDNHLLAVNKPAGLVTQGAAAGRDSLVAWARAYLKQKYKKPGNVYVGIVSRLDAPVTGVVLVARTSKAAARLTEQFRQRDVTKIYWALVSGNPPPQGALAHLLAKENAGKGMRLARGGEGGQQAELVFRVLRRLNEQSLLEVRPSTGRKHQIRLQLAAAGYPIVGDRAYGSLREFPQGIALHARRLVFVHPVKRQSLSVAAPLPSYWPFQCRELAAQDDACSPETEPS